MDALVNDVFQDSATRNALPVFLQDWWLAAARAAIARPYREARVFREGMIVGYLGCTLKRNRIGIRTWEPFDWCRVNEPVLSQSLNEADKTAVLRELLQQLPRDYSYEFVCGPTAKDLPLIKQVAAEAGFKQRRETVFWQTPELAKDVLQRISKKYRQGIKKAAEELEIFDLSPDAFIQLYDSNLKAARRRPYSDSKVAKALITAGLNRRQPQARIFAARKKSAPPGCRLIDAAIACVWDDERYYYWMTTCSRFTGASEGKAHTHAVKYLLTAAMQDAGARGLIFDTDGGDTKGAIKQFRDLKFENTAERIVFMRHKLPLRIYNQVRPHVKELVNYVGLQAAAKRLDIPSRPD